MAKEDGRMIITMFNQNSLNLLRTTKVIS
ncbi:uncharacterized protein METZ01_LOCUS499920, partial [marine metagenome]